MPKHPKTFSGLEDAIRELARRYVADMTGRDVVDLVDAMTYELPAQVVFLLLGEQNVDPRRIKAWADKRLAIMFGRLDHDALMAAGAELVDFWRYAQSIVAARVEAPGDDLPSFLLATRGGDDAVLTMNEIESILFALLLAGHETTTNASTNLVLELLSDRSLWDRIVAEPGLAGAAVEEGLRHASSVVTWRRQAIHEIEVGGVTIPAGGVVLLALGSANRDEARFEDGERFDLDRANARDHFAFGKGIHMCLGAPLARIEMRVIVEELTAAFPDMRLAESRTIDWLPTISFRGPLALEVRPGG